MVLRFLNYIIYANISNSPINSFELFEQCILSAGKEMRGLGAKASISKGFVWVSFLIFYQGVVV